MAHSVQARITQWFGAGVPWPLPLVWPTPFWLSLLSFLGIGLPPESASWGNVLQNARSYPLSLVGRPFSRLGIFITITIFNLIGEGVGEAVAP